MRKFLAMICLLPLFTGCLHGQVVRDAAVYRTELDLYESWATRQAALLGEFLADHCKCDAERKFTTQRCADSADFVLTVRARAAWHRDMSIYNAGLSDDRPPLIPPEIPESSTLCPPPVETP